MFHRFSLRSLLALHCTVCFLIATHAQLVFAQASTATLVGAIEDTTGGALPNAAVTVTERDRNTEQVTHANEAGSYVLSRSPFPDRVSRPSVMQVWG